MKLCSVVLKALFINLYNSRGAPINVLIVSFVQSCQFIVDIDDLSSQFLHVQEQALTRIRTNRGLYLLF